MTHYLFRVKQYNEEIVYKAILYNKIQSSWLWSLSGRVTYYKDLMFFIPFSLLGSELKYLKLKSDGKAFIVNGMDPKFCRAFKFDNLSKSICIKY